MNPNPARPGQSAASEQGSAARPDADQDSAQSERLGPLVVQRLAKDDGRQLIVYSRAGDDR